MKITIHDAISGETIEREMTADEQTHYDLTVATMTKYDGEEDTPE